MGKMGHAKENLKRKGFVGKNKKKGVISADLNHTKEDRFSPPGSLGRGKVETVQEIKEQALVVLGVEGKREKTIPWQKLLKKKNKTVERGKREGDRWVWGQDHDQGKDRKATKRVCGETAFSVDKQAARRGDGTGVRGGKERLKILVQN